MTLGAGSTGYTMRTVMDRLFQQWLTPPDDQDAQALLSVSIDDVETSIKFGGFTIPEDEALLRQGSLLEADQELMRVLSYSTNTQTVEVLRGQYSTKAVPHTAPSLLTLNPPFTRASVYEAVADNIITLSPKLFTTRQEYISTVSAGIFPLNDDLATEVLSAWADGWTGSTNVHAEIVDFHQLTGGRAIITNGNGGGSLWFRYRRRMGKPESEADLLEDLGVDERWVSVIMAGAAADLMAGKDIAPSQTEWVKNVLEAENIRVGTRMSIGGGLRQYRNMLLDDFSKEMDSEYNPQVFMQDPFKQIV